MKTDRSGQAVLEYILLLSIVIGIVALAAAKLRNGSDLTAALNGAKIEKMLRTGAAPVAIWNK